jgi:pterin-4a-carbinolamine dehydratase
MISVVFVFVVGGLSENDFILASKIDKLQPILKRIKSAAN